MGGSEGPKKRWLSQWLRLYEPPHVRLKLNHNNHLIRLLATGCVCENTTSYKVVSGEITTSYKVVFSHNNHLIWDQSSGCEPPYIRLFLTQEPPNKVVVVAKQSTKKRW